MNLQFFKYQGAGNDFVIIDNRDQPVRLSAQQIRDICDRHYGVGADGLMLLETDHETDFKMVYYNSDGHESTMCGNGGRCIAAFAKRLDMVPDIMTFRAVDGMHRAGILLPDGMVSLQMQDVPVIDFYADHTELNTGSPHYVKMVTNIEEVDVFLEGRAIRLQSKYQPQGINVNFFRIVQEEIHIRTYERGVEDETLACGTGVTAVAIASVGKQTGVFTIPVYTRGGLLTVNFTKKTPASAEDIQLTGPAEFVFEGVFPL